MCRHAAPEAVETDSGTVETVNAAALGSSTYNISRCEKPATARGLLIRDRCGGIWECKVEHMLIRNAPSRFRGVAEVFVVDYGEDGTLRASQRQ